VVNIDSAATHQDEGPTGGGQCGDGSHILVEVWFGLIERESIRRGTYASVKDLNAQIRAFIDGWNDRCHRFVWTTTADDILNKVNRRPRRRRARPGQSTSETLS
jgi:hypothetical protein